MKTPSIPAPTDMCVIATYRCPMRCRMCNIWQHPTDKSREIRPEELEVLPRVKFVNITGANLSSAKTWRTWWKCCQARPTVS